MEFLRGINFTLIFYTIWSISNITCSQFIRLKELENKFPTETALVEFQASLQNCLVVCNSEKTCRALFHTQSSQHCGLYASFDNTKLSSRESTVFYGQYSTDAALGKPVVQSSLCVDSGPWPAELAVDGAWLSSFSVGYIVCSSTDVGDLYPWWYVDLTERLRILSIKLLARGDIAGHRLMDVDVVVGDNTTHFDAFCGNYFGPANNDELVGFNCAPDTFGRYVKVLKPRHHAHPEDLAPYMLSLCEVGITTLHN